MQEILIPRNHLDSITAHCSACYPNEACGLLAGNCNRVLQVFPVTNVEPSPASYFMDPGEQFICMKEIRAAGQKLVGIFHSHPQSPAVPSQEDVRRAVYDEPAYLIIGMHAGKVAEIKAFSIRDGRVEAVAVTIID